MPAYGKNLSPAETTALVAFLETLHPQTSSRARCSTRGSPREKRFHAITLSMPPSVQFALESWSCPVGLTLAVVLTGIPVSSRVASSSFGFRERNFFRESWQFFSRTVLDLAGSGLTSRSLRRGIADRPHGSAFAAHDRGSSLILVGAPVMPLLHALPRKVLRSILGPLFRLPAMQGIGRALSQPAFCWLAASAALLGWHVPAAFTVDCNRKRGMRLSTPVSSDPDFFSGGPLCSRGRVFRDGRVGRCSSTFFSLPCRVDILSAFLRSATVLFTEFTFQRRSTLGFPLSKTSNAQAHGCGLASQSCT